MREGGSEGNDQMNVGSKESSFGQINNSQEDFLLLSFSFNDIF